MDKEYTLHPERVSVIEAKAWLSGLPGDGWRIPTGAELGFDDRYFSTEDFRSWGAGKKYPIAFRRTEEQFALEIIDASEAEDVVILEEGIDCGNQ